jgi:hypothetical protein
MTLTLATAATAGAADSVTVNLNSATATAAADAVLTVTDGGTEATRIETLNIATSGGASSLGDVAFGGATLNITGDQNLTIRSGLDAGLDTLSAGSLTGALVMTSTNDATTPDATVAGVDVLPT